MELYIYPYADPKNHFLRNFKEKEKGERAEDRTRTQARNYVKTLV